MLGSKYIGSSSESVEANSEGLIPRTLLELLRRADVNSITLSALGKHGVRPIKKHKCFQKHTESTHPKSKFMTSQRMTTYWYDCEHSRYFFIVIFKNLDFSKKTPLTRTQITNRTYVQYSSFLFQGTQFLRQILKKNQMQKQFCKQLGILLIVNHTSL